ncbi:unnamed protein product, partial [Onchocerca ochengi]
SFFQSLCVLGYCLLPPGLAAIICKLIEINPEQTVFLFALRLLVTTAGFIWAIYGVVKRLVILFYKQYYSLFWFLPEILPSKKLRI